MTSSHQMLDSAGKRVAEQGQLQFLVECRERLDIPDGCWQRITLARRSHRKRAVAYVIRLQLKLL